MDQAPANEPLNEPLNNARNDTRNDARNDPGPETDATSDHDDEPGGNRAAILALGVVVLLILGGLWLTHVLGGAASTQDCLASGRTNCAPVSPSN
jgi:hypothetical protein